MSASVRLIPTAGIRTERATTAAVNLQGGRFPNFVHKWSKRRKTYAAADLYLPEYVHVAGQRPRFEDPVVAVGGTRSPTVETFCLVSRVVRELVRGGVSILSGGVPGVDMSAHLAALEIPGGSTFAVLANPAESGLLGHEWHNGLVERNFLERGGFISEYSNHCEFGSDEYRERLLARDRIITGLSDLFIAFECNVNSATVDTARRALVQGKQVVCIETAKETPRRGIAQMEGEIDLLILREAEMSDVEMASTILELLARAPGAALVG